MDRSSFVLLLVLLGLAGGLANQAPPPSTPDDYPSDWNNAPGSLDDFPVEQVDNKTVIVIDPWIYQQRLGIFKVLVHHTQEYFDSWGYNNTGNLLWGLPLQFGWQMTSGRLRDMACESSMENRVAPNSWWADMNYFLSVLPFLGALNAGVFSPLKFAVHITKPGNVSDKFCTSIQECSVRHADVILHWTQFFERVRLGFSDQSPTITPEQDATIALLWKAHTTSLRNALPLFTNELALLSTPEQNFGEGWALLVEFIAATHFETNLNETSTQQKELPPRILTTKDNPPFIPDLTPGQNRVLEAINLFRAMNTDTKGWLLKFWLRAMCTPERRVVGRELLENIIENPSMFPKLILKLIWRMAIDHC